ncbi:TIGR02921 family PEP-CTERM protein [Brunnivagina elsteri]|uniref:PEP-CTERM sorting domain-containing protein n=1 Tax=Brunnivagina elsteri CCALA 953 TaxID=987040 RepID=A0A2A2TCR4_9CYAN|nr:TIGR02921 family PEP-CTERM protein [Calothrix elsteri]PAX51425.1 PEP-CTERM sorting domain-containing protein [Calothrix elsteri CCALA 953]
MKSFFNAIFQAIFWGWNLIFLSVVYLGILPFIGIFLILATFEGQIPIEFFFSLCTLIAVPVACTIIGGKKFSSQPLELLRLFYAVEAPLVLLCGLRLFVFRELTPASVHILISIGVCISAFAAEMLYGYANTKRSIAWLQMLVHSLMLFVGIYAGSILLFYALPVAAWLIVEILKFEWAINLWQIFIANPVITIVYGIPFYFLLFGMTCSLFVAMPSLVAYLYTTSGIKILKAFAAQYGTKKAVAGFLGVAIATFTLFISFQQQPQVKAFSLLNNPPQTDNARQVLLSKSDTIRSGLVNAYLSNYRYLSSVKDNNHIENMYEKIFGFPKSVNKSIQNIYNQLMSPFLYNGTESDVQKADKLYSQFFDLPIQKGEQNAINHALESTSNLDEAKAGLLNLNQKKVWLKQQEVTTKEHKDWANVELHEIYENTTRDVQEVFYSFSLPESAVITGLWLGDTADLSKRFEYVLSPRGAAQKVYNQQVQRARPIDPALLEQVGPRHYRLRAFPIPVKPSPAQLQSQGNIPTEMHLWLTYKVMRQDKGWALPQLGEKRNIYWTNGLVNKTKRIRNGQVINQIYNEKNDKNQKSDDWLEAYLPGNKELGIHTVNLSFSTNEYKITAKPLNTQDYSLPINQRFAIVLDTSRSMNSHIQELEKTWNWLRKEGFANNNLADNDADLYLTSIPGTEPKRLDDINQFKPGKMTFYGTMQLKEMLQQFDKMRGNTNYDGILLVTDEGSYELSDDKKNLPKINSPLWLVHLGSLPKAYDDTIIKAIADSNGGVSTDISEVLKRQATKSKLGNSVVNVIDGYAWFMEKLTNPSSSLSTPNSFDSLAARQLITGLSREKNLDQLAELDAIHELAKRFKIVTPYSSMIVLVNDEQRRQLKEAEADKDRFNRKIESGKEDLTKPSNPLKSASIPEPSTGIAVVIAGILFFVFTKKRRMNVN